MSGMRLRKPCEHDRYDEHPIRKSVYRSGVIVDRLALGHCPGGEFLPEDALVIEKENGEWPDWVVVAGQTNGDGLNLSADEVEAALNSIVDSFQITLADQVGEPG